MRILIATDAWRPQVNGVVRTLEATIRELGRRGVDTFVVSPDKFRSAAMPGYNEIRIAWPRMSTIRTALDRFAPDHVHIATEGPIGWAMRRVCLQRGLPFTTTTTRGSRSTFAPAAAGAGGAQLPCAPPLPWLRPWNDGRPESIGRELSRARLPKSDALGARRRSGGIPSRRRGRCALRLEASCFLSVGRLAPEKNLEAFLSLDLPGTKVAGDGPSAEDLKARFPDAVFLGALGHAKLPALYAQSGRVRLSQPHRHLRPRADRGHGMRAARGGLSLRRGPLDVVGGSGVGVRPEDLRKAALAALRIDRAGLPAACGELHLGARDRPVPAERRGRRIERRARPADRPSRASRRSERRCRRVSPASQRSSAPAARLRNFSQTMSGSTTPKPAKVEKPQSVPAITRSRPTMRVKFCSRSATSSGCSTKFVVESRQPGIST